MVEVERGSFFMVGSMVRTERGWFPLPAHWFYALARSVWVDHLPRGRLGVVAGALLVLVAGAGAAGRGVFSLSVAWRGGVMPAERRAESIS
jgi:hypothetical protein